MISQFFYLYIIIFHRVQNTKEKLKKLGIDFDFTPSDIPEQLLNYNPAVKVSRENST